MKQIIIAYYSGRGHTKKVADSIAIGVNRIAGMQAVLLNVTEYTPQQFSMLSSAAGIIFGSPTYMGSVAAEFKFFLEKLAGDIWVQQQLADKIAAGFTVATYPAGDKASTLYQLCLFASQHGMLWAGNNMIGSQISGDGLRLNSDGAWLGLSATASRDKSQLINQHDCASAILFGERIATACHRWYKSTCHNIQEPRQCIAS